MQSKEVTKALDEAIDRMDLEQIEAQLVALDGIEDDALQIEDSKFFAKKIMMKSRKGNNEMKSGYKKWGTAVAGVLCALAISGGTIYATGLYKTFSFFGEKTSTFIKTTDMKLADTEAKQLADEAAQSYGTVEASCENTINSQRSNFGSFEEVKEALNIDIVVPGYIPEGLVQDADIYVETIAHESFGRKDNVYTTYSDKEDEGRRFGVTVIKEDMKQDVTSIVTTDGVYAKEYTNAQGDVYTLFSEDGGVIAQRSVGNIEYVLVFMGIDETEIYKTIDSADLSIYGQ
ncbi:MAG: hypothetical protein ACRCTE_07835 [Cellulosilyticaceae bacterium]